LNLAEASNSEGLPELLEGMTERGAKSKTSGAIEGAKEKLGLGGDDDDDGDSGKVPSRRRSSSRSRRSSEDDDG
jgi:hypothetical protein